MRDADSFNRAPAALQSGGFNKLSRDKPVTDLRASGTATTLRVMVADDNQALCQVLAQLIDECPGLSSVAPVFTRDDLVKSVLVQRPDVLVLDLNIGGTSSLTLLTELRAVSPSTRVVIHSGYQLEALASDAARRGAVAYVAKGGDPDTLIEAIRRAGQP